MERNDNFILHQVADKHVLVSGNSNAKLPGKITMSESAVLIWNLLAADQTVPQLVSAITGEYDVPADVAERDICDLLRQMRMLNLLVMS